MNVTPGYDFGTTEIPTKEKLSLMVTGMSITDIGYEQLQTTIIGITVTDASQTSLPAEGWLWGDARSNIWLKTRLGMVRVRCAEGGWESLRWPYGVANTASNWSVPGSMVQFHEFIVGNTLESNAVLRVNSGGSKTGSTWHVGVTQETVPSTATTAPGYFRTVYRGWTRFYAPDFSPMGTAVTKGRLWRSSVNTPEWVITDAYDNTDALVYGDATGRDPDGDLDNYCYGYFYPGLLTTP